MAPTFKSSLQLALGVTVLGLVSASTSYEGYGTVYTLSSPSDGNCNFMSAPADASTKYAALNADQWDDTMNCGRCAEVSCTDASCAGQSSEVVYIMDQCPGCSYGDLDLSPDVFESITGQSYTKLSIEWKFVDCPVSKNVQYCLKTGSSEFWVAVQPANFVSGVQSLSINGQDASVLDSAYYFLIDGSGESVADLSSVSISLTGVNGEVLEETLSLTADECTDGSSQFASSGDESQSTPSTQTSTTSAPTTATPTSAPATAAPTPVPTTATPIPTTTTTPTPTPTATSSRTTSVISSSSGSSSYIASTDSNSTSASADDEVAGFIKTKTGQRSDASGSIAVEATVTATPSAVSSSTAAPDETVQSNVQSSGGSHSTPLMIGMVALVCAAVVIAVALAVYVRHRKRQIDSYKRREDQGTAMSDADMSPRASDASSTYDFVNSPNVHFLSMESM
uniref:Expansin-like EG45 domain-containing protein n=2 Tax=Phytophthora ramorum TaxID=164328 RepID=H3GRF3_PHYRM